MEGFTYHNIFETKALEYLAIVFFFIILIPFWFFLNKKVTVTKKVEKLAALTAGALQIPQGLFFSKYHTWAHLERSGIAQVGMDDLLMHLTGEVAFTRVKATGEKIRKGDLMAEISHKGKRLRVYSPISGEIMEANAVLSHSPELLNEDPYLKGWMYKIKPSSWVADTNACFVAEDATLWAKQELERFKDFLSVSLGKYSPQPSQLVLQDGGELCDQPLSDLPEQVWQDFQEDFLNKKTLKLKKNCFMEQHHNENEH
ncbi:MAG: glycine cleavage system protein H [Candidatus Saccharibacteria bacterium]